MAKLSNIITAGEKKYGKGTFLKASAAPRDFARIPTGIFSLDLTIGGGLPTTASSSFWGPPGCLSGNTIIGVCRGKRKGSRFYRLWELYLKLRGLPLGDGRRYHRWNNNLQSKALSLKENRLSFNAIKDVVYSGRKKTYEVITSSEKKIRATLDHKFKIPSEGKYVKLENLSIGDTVLCRKSTHASSNLISTFDYRKSVTNIPHHPYGWNSLIRGKNYKRMVFARLVVEAYMNDMDVYDFIDILKNNSVKASTLYFLPIDFHVHHKDQDSSNDDIDNLEVILPKEHFRLHGNSLHFPNQNVEKEEIISIEEYGEEDTYDIVMDAPYHNFVANGFIVHNSAKTYIAQKTIVQSNMLCHRCYKYDWQCECKEGPLKMKTLYIDAEGSFAWDWAEDIGVPEDTDIVYGLTGEEYVDIYHSAIRAEDIGFIIIDSIADLTPNAEMAGSAEDNYVMTQARLVSYMIRKGKTLLMKERKMGHNVCILMLNQVRAKPAKFGQPSEDAPGGNASKHDFTLSGRTGRRSVKKMDDSGLPEHSTVSVSLGSAMSKKKCLVLAGSCQFDVLLTRESLLKRGTVLDFGIVLKYAVDNNFISEVNSNNYIFDGIDYKKEKILELLQNDDQMYYSLQKQIIDKVKQEAINKSK